MFKVRIEKLRKKITQLGLDAFLVMAPENRRYLSGFTGSSGVLLITKNQNFLLTDFRYIDQAKIEAPDFQVIRYDGSLVETIKNILERLFIETLGFEEDFITYKQYRELREGIPKIKIFPEAGLVEKIRMIKDQEEIATIARAAKVADEAFNYILGKIRPGLTEIEIALELEFFMRSQGASSTSFSTIVASGARSALPHGVASEKLIEKGDFVTLDFGCIYQGYCSDMTRTVVIGEPDRKQREVYQVVLEAQILALENIKAGMSCQEIDALSRTYIAEKGYGQYFGHGLGHGVGLAVHEHPSLSPRDNTELVPNMVVTVEPGIYLPGWGGVRIEDLVVVEEAGLKNLTDSPKDLIVI